MMAWCISPRKGYFIFPTKDGGNLYMKERDRLKLHKGSMAFDQMIPFEHIRWEKIKIPDKYKDVLLSEKSLILKGYL